MSRRPELQSWLKDQHGETGLSRRQGYDRLLLQAEDDQKLYDLLETITFEESMDWINLPQIIPPFVGQGKTISI